MGVYLIGEGPTASGQRYSLQISSASPGRGCPDKDDDPPLRTLLTVLTVFSNVVCILMTLLPARPSRPNANVDAQGPQERLRAPQAAGEGAGILGPAGAVAPVAATIGAGPQKIGGGPCPGRCARP